MLGAFSGNALCSANVGTHLLPVSTVDGRAGKLCPTVFRLRPMMPWKAHFPETIGQSAVHWLAYSSCTSSFEKWHGSAATKKTKKREVYFESLWTEESYCRASYYSRARFREGRNKSIRRRWNAINCSASFDDLIDDLFDTLGDSHPASYLHYQWI